MFQVTIYTDGACKGNPGPGGYAAIISCKGKEKVVKGHEPESTNNRQELVAVIEGLRALTKPCEIRVFTDSNYVVTGAANLEKWTRRKNLKNQDLWFQYIKVLNNGKHKIEFVKVKGHSGNPNNERCDQIAKAEVCIAIGG